MIHSCLANPMLSSVVPPRYALHHIILGIQRQHCNISSANNATLHRPIPSPPPPKTSSILGTNPLIIPQPRNPPPITPLCQNRHTLIHTPIEPQPPITQARSLLLHHLTKKLLILLTRPERFSDDLAAMPHFELRREALGQGVAIRTVCVAVFGFFEFGGFGGFFGRLVFVGAFGLGGWGSRWLWFLGLSGLLAVLN